MILSDYSEMMGDRGVPYVVQKCERKGICLAIIVIYKKFAFLR